jgi:cysteine desulfurase / selenocysteine lyase
MKLTDVPCFTVSSQLSQPVDMSDCVLGLDRQVPLLDGTHRTYINLDNAASTPVLREVMDTVNQFMAWYSSVHRGTGFKSLVATKAYEDARGIVAGFAGANVRDHLVIFGKNTTEAINKLSYRLPLSAEDVVLVSMMEHHSNDLPWRAKAHMVHIGVDTQGALDEADLDRLLALHAGRVKLIALSGGSNVTGYRPDIHRLARKAHASGAQILVDCAQLAPHRRIDMGALDDPAHLDYIAISAHKMYAPFGTGALIGRRDTFEKGEPEYRGGGTIDFVSLDSVAWADSPDRDEAGSPNVVGAIALAASMQVMQGLGMDMIAQHEAELTAYALERLSCIPGLKIYGDKNPTHAASRLGVIPFNLEGVSHFLVAAILSAEYGIGVRNGCFCAHPYLMCLLGITKDKALQVQSEIVTKDRRHMPGMVRISFGLYNSVRDIDALIMALKAIAKGNYSGKYQQDQATGEYHALNWSPDMNQYFDLNTLALPSYREMQCALLPPVTTPFASAPL